MRGFLPASLVDIRRVPNLDEYMGTAIECKVIELNRSRNNVVLSRRAVLEEERKEQRQQILDRLQPGLIIEGQISNIVDFGAFVDLDGIDGLIHISELSWSHVNHPSEILNIGDTVQVKVLDIDRDRQRISLGLKQTQEDPWQRVVDTYSVNDELEGKVTKVVAFGAFVEILEGVEGLVHISELAAHHVENPREVVSPGDEVRVKILEIDSERRRLSLSVKRVEGQELPIRSLDAAGAGDLDDMPELGLSEDVFAEPAALPAAEAAPEAPEAEAAEAAEARPPRRRPRPRPPRPRRPRRRPRTPAPRPRPPTSTVGRGARGRRGDPRARHRRGVTRAAPFVGLTGGIGAGKSEALAALERLGAATLSTDAVVHELYAGDEVRAAVVERWGDEVAAGRRRSTAPPSPARAFATPPRSGPGSRACCGRGRPAHAGVPRGARAGRRRRWSSRCRCSSSPAWTRALRRHDRRRRRRGRARAARGRPRARGGRRADLAPAHAGGEGCARHLRCAQQRHRSRSSSARCPTSSTH